MTFTIAQTVQTMIDCNAGMVFNYAYSQPELQRIAHPIIIIGNHVVCVEADTGRHKRFKLDGIRFPPEEDLSNELEKMNINVEGTINSCIKSRTKLVFTYEKSHPERVREVIPEKLVDNRMYGFDEGAYKSFYVSHIIPFIKCEGCRYDCPGQRDHMGYGGCLSE